MGLSQFPVLQQNIQTLHLIGKLPVHINLQYYQTDAADSDLEQDTVDPFWGNNWEASSSTSPQVPRCFSRMEMVHLESTYTRVDLDNANLEIVQLETNEIVNGQKEPDDGRIQLDGTEVVIEQNEDRESNQELPEIDNGLQLALLPEDVSPQPIQMIQASLSKKRKSRKRPTPIVDDEIQRSTRQH